MNPPSDDGLDARAFVPRRIESQNAFQYSHWRKYWKYSMAWRLHLLAVMGCRSEPTDGFRRVSIVSVRRRLLDVGNLIGGAKPIPDALKALGWIRDDSPEWMSADYDQRVRAPSEEEGTLVEIWKEKKKC